MKQEVQEAIEKRDKFLEEHPHAKKFQKEIDNVLNKTPDDMKLDVLIIMMVGELQKLQQNMELIGKLNHEKSM